MTVSGAEESEPLLVAGVSSYKKGRYNYRSLYNFPMFVQEKVDKVADATSLDNDIYLHQLRGVTLGTDAPDTPRYPVKNGEEVITPRDCRQAITYTWNSINVYASRVEETRTARLWKSMRRLAGCGEQQAVGQQRKQILNSVNGAAYPGELMALMGSSGAGKTTLLNTLTFRSSSNVMVSGVRAINGIPVSSNTLTSLSAYVQQDDLFIGTLTVREHLIFQALVRMDRDLPYSHRMHRVNQVIAELALTKCENTTIGIPGRIKGISGGEMKRLSFASEVLTDPPLMFCDEPTSGLDSFMAQNVVSVLKSMAMKGKTVVCTIHQPSSEVFSMFDKVLLLAEGRVAYLGRPEEACGFFKELGAACPTNYNPADFFIQLLAVVPNKEETCRETIDLVCDAFDRSPPGVQLAIDTELLSDFQAKAALTGGLGNPPTWELDHWKMGDSKHSYTPYKASWCSQFRAVLWRSWLSVIKEPMLIKMVAIMISIIYYRQQPTQDGVMNINGALFIFLTNMTFQNVFAVINVFCTELPVFMREHFNGMYRVDVYFLCKTLAEVPIFLVIPVIFTSITYYIIGLYPDFTHFLITTLIIILVANVATSFGYLISCVSTGVTMALSIGPPVVIPFLLFGGFFLNSGSVPVYFKWLSYLSWFNYGNEALLINQWRDVDYIDCTRSNSTCPRNGDIVLETYNFKKEHFFMDLLCLFTLILAFRFLAYLALLSRTFRKE